MREIAYEKMSISHFGGIFRGLLIVPYNKNCAFSRGYVISLVDAAPGLVNYLHVIQPHLVIGLESLVGAVKRNAFWLFRCEELPQVHHSTVASPAIKIDVRIPGFPHAFSNTGDLYVISCASLCAEPAI